MKEIIIGQLLLWLNVATILAGWWLIDHIQPPEGIQNLLMTVGVLGSLGNVFFSLAIQARAYSKMGMIDLS